MTFILLLIIAVIVLLPPKYDPAIKQKEMNEDLRLWK